MAAKGTVLKGEIMQKILQTFPGSFLYNDGKEIRINGTESGIPLQIKLTLTCSKEIVDGGDGTNISADNELDFSVSAPQQIEQVPQEPTEDEKARLARLLSSLGLT